jgi:hypothetical protein
MADLTFDSASGRFRDSAGRYVSDARVRAVVDAVADQASARMAAASERLMAGQMSLASWQAEMQNTIKVSHLAASTLAHGGEAQMTPARYLMAAREIKAQYQYLRGFAAQIQSGEQPLNGGLISRAKQYGQAARVAFERERGRDQQSRGYQFERNVLGPARDHCSLCPELSARGWVPIGSLPPVGSRPCRAQDRCRISYSRTAEQAA